MKVYVQHRLAKFQAVQHRSRGSHLYVLCRSVCEWDQNWYKRSMPFLRADQGIKVTSELQTKNQATNSNDQVIKHTFGNQKSWSQVLQQVTWKWLPLVTPGTSSHSLISKPLVSDDWKTWDLFKFFALDKRQLACALVRERFKIGPTSAFGPRPLSTESDHKPHDKTNQRSYVSCNPPVILIVFPKASPKVVCTCPPPSGNKMVSFRTTSYPSFSPSRAGSQDNTALLKCCK